MRLSEGARAVEPAVHDERYKLAITQRVHAENCESVEHLVHALGRYEDRDGGAGLRLRGVDDGKVIHRPGRGLDTLEPCGITSLLIAPNWDTPTSYPVVDCHLCLTSSMHQWDVAATARLQDIVELLRSTRVVDVLERTVALVWRANTARYEPGDLGDTARSLGVTAAENIRELVLRERWSPGMNGDLGRDVHVTAPNDSLLIESSGVSLRVMKAPSMITLARPNWLGFSWANESDVRKAAARNNRVGYNPYLIGTGTLFDDSLPVDGDPSTLREVLLVWAGGSASPFTGGWLGLPILSEDRPWLAVQKLWWHEVDGHGSRRGRGGDTDPDLDTFERRPLPQPEVRLKPKPKTAEQ